MIVTLVLATLALTAFNTEELRQEPTAPKPVSISVSQFEVPTDLNLKLTASVVARQGDKSDAKTFRVVAVLADDTIEKELRRLAKEKTVRLVSAPRVRTLSGMEATVGIQRDAKASSVRESFSMTPHVLNSGAILLEVSGKSTSGSEKSDRPLVWWSFSEKRELADGKTLYVDLNFVDDQNAPKRLILLITAAKDAVPLR